ncbi:UvrD-helicase domain-containing protein [Pseudomonas aeruginosa]|uniref:UvrD-helicase domain-containing protein n=1 Tax=Pseudomonas aeruginosa TaxID=287 RepID=UPI000EB1B3A4|nr:UvrD-helicase domain-containing protein [Pseudomonas aeruginosa]HBO2745112.1 AAA family ATPase [Pseudomonas aeruginosa]HDY6331755.1 AAA family ATPase [Pseudomonas aeruginosa]
MKTLPQVTATPEQLPLVSQNRLGIEVICGAAGSGKTSTALLRLNSLCHMFAVRLEREHVDRPIKILVLTFNRTLAGYIRELAEHQVPDYIIDLEIDTFSRWAINKLGYDLGNQAAAQQMLSILAQQIQSLSTDYVLKECDYILGRFEPENLELYLTTERTGRGALPRVPHAVRQQILDQVIRPYHSWLEANETIDWNQLAVCMARDIPSLGYDIVIVDESQDFSANQLRAIKHHLAENHTITFVIDTVQRIYARGFTWTEVGFDVRSRTYTLRNNHRNTIEIAAFASGILNGIGVEGDGALPNLHAASVHGDLPLVLRGRYSNQLSWAINYIRRNIDLSTESVAFLKPQGGGWFNVIHQTLDNYGIEYASITRERDWPEDPINVATCSFHSAKGLEFDYVFILGFNQENTNFLEEERDDQILVLRRLLAVAVARARKAVFLGYKPGEESRLTQFFAPGTFREENV